MPASETPPQTQSEEHSAEQKDQHGPPTANHRWQGSPITQRSGHSGQENVADTDNHAEQQGLRGTGKRRSPDREEQHQSREEDARQRLRELDVEVDAQRRCVDVVELGLIDQCRNLWDTEMHGVDFRRKRLSEVRKVWRGHGSHPIFRNFDPNRIRQEPPTIPDMAGGHCVGTCNGKTVFTDFVDR